MNTKSKITLTALLILFVALTRAMAQFTYNAIDLGTLGGPTSTANAVDPSGQVRGFSLAADGSAHAFLCTNGAMNDLGALGGVMMIDPTAGGNQNGALGNNALGQVVGFAATTDGSIHAFLSANGEMSDLNAITNLSAGGFKVLTVAKAINDSSLIVGDGIMTTGDRHAFLLVPVGAATQGAPSVIPTEGGQWSYTNEKWVWAASDGGWWWENNGWNWHGSGKPPRHHPHTPPPPPPPPPPPAYNLTPGIGRRLTPGVGRKLPPPAPTSPPTFNKTPFLTPGLGKSPITEKLTPPAPSPSPPPWWQLTPPPPQPTPSPTKAPHPSATPAPPWYNPITSPSPSPTLKPSGTPRHKPVRKASPTPSPNRSPYRHTANGPKPSPTAENQEHHHHP